MSRTLQFLTGLVAIGPTPMLAQGSFAPTLGVSVGIHSSDHSHLIYAIHLTVPVAATWDITPWFRGSAASKQEWRASLALRHAFPLSPTARAYAGAGGSWTHEPSEVLAHGHWGAVGLVGLAFVPGGHIWEQGRLQVFSEMQVFTHHYATAQWLVGLKLRLGS